MSCGAGFGSQGGSPQRIFVRNCTSTGRVARFRKWRKASKGRYNQINKLMDGLLQP
jgi:hypothetical protein